jgi:Phage P22-like portal protein
MADDDERNTKDDDIVHEAQKRFERCVEWESQARTWYREDLKFANGDSRNGWQWLEGIARARDILNKPCLTFNQVREFNLLVKNEAKQNKASIQIRPTGGEGSFDAAEVYEGIIRYIEYRSRATVQYGIAGDLQVDGGIGYLRVKNQFVSDKSMNQELVIKAIRDSLTVYMDPDRLEPDGEDMRYCFIFQDVPKDDFDKEYKKWKDKVGTNTLGNSGDSWITKSHVRVAEYYRIELTDDQLVAYTGDDGQIRMQRKSEIDPKLRKWFMDEVLTPEKLETGETRIRDIQVPTVEWYKIAGDQIIDREIWLGKTIPIVPMIGEETIIDGKLDRKGHTRHMISAQQMFNYNSSAAVETGALQTRVPFLGAIAAFEGFETVWATANIDNPAYLPYNHIDDEGNEIPAPTRIEPPTPAPVFTEGMAAARQQMMMVSGQYQAQTGEQENAKSGKAINARQRQGDTATYHFIDNQGIAISRVGRIILEAFRFYYDVESVVLMMDASGDESKVHIDPKAAQAYQKLQQEGEEEARIVFNPNVGEYDAEADVGPNYATRRQQAWDAFVQIVTQAPTLLSIVGDVMFHNADFPDADKIAERLRKEIEATKPYLLDEGMSPQYTQVMNDLTTAKSTIAELLQKLAEKELKLIGKDEKRDIDSENAKTKRMEVLVNAMAKIVLTPADRARMEHELTVNSHSAALDMIVNANKPEIASQA